MKNKNKTTKSAKSNKSNKSTKPTPNATYFPDIKKVSESFSEVIPNIRWAPLRGIPFERRIQTATVLSWCFLLGNCLILFGISLAIPILWPLHIAYILFICFDKAPVKGGRRSEWFRRLPIWSYYAAYFPIKLVKVNSQLYQ